MVMVVVVAAAVVLSRPIIENQWEPRLLCQNDVHLLSFLLSNQVPMHALAHRIDIEYHVSKQRGI